MAPFFMVRTHKSDAKAPMIGDNGKFETANGNWHGRRKQVELKDGSPKEKKAKRET